MLLMHTRAIPAGTNIQQSLYMQNPADTFDVLREKHQQMHVEQNEADTL